MRAGAGGNAREKKGSGTSALAPPPRAPLPDFSGKPSKGAGPLRSQIQEITKLAVKGQGQRSRAGAGGNAREKRVRQILGPAPRAPVY